MALGFFPNAVPLFAQGCEGPNHCLQQLGKNTVRLDGHDDKFSQSAKETNPSGTCQRQVWSPQGRFILWFGLYPLRPLVISAHFWSGERLLQAACSLCYHCPFSWQYSRFFPSYILMKSFWSFLIVWWNNLLSHFCATSLVHGPANDSCKEKATVVELAWERHPLCRSSPLCPASLQLLTVSSMRLSTQY